MPTLSFTWDTAQASENITTKLQAAVAVLIPQQLNSIRDVWVAAVSGLQLPGMDQQVNSPPYAAALQRQGVIDYPDSGNPLWGRVIVTDLAATKIEQGRVARDMKPSLLSGPKARRGKKGQRYNVIPIGVRSPRPGMSPFATVSDFSSPNSWIYPASPGVEVAAAVTDYMRPLVGQALRETILREWRT